MKVSKNIKLFYAFNFFTDFKLYAPIAIIYFTKVTGSLALGMSVFSMIMLSSAILEIPTGVFSDFLGRKGTLVAGSLAAVLYTLSYAVAPSYLVLLIGAFFEGLSRALYSGNNNALLYDSLKDLKQEKQFEKHLGKTSSLFQVALASSALLGGLVSTISFSWVMWISFLSQLICFFIGTQFVEPSYKKMREGNIYAHLKEAVLLFVENPKLRLLSIGSILNYGFTESGYQFQAAVFNLVWPVWLIGIGKAVGNVMASAGFFFSDVVIKKVQSIKLLIFDQWIYKIFEIITLMFSLTFAPFVLIFGSLPWASATVAQEGLLQKEFSDHQRATMSSLNSLGCSLFFALVAILLGFLGDSISSVSALIILKFFSFFPGFFFWLLYRKHLRQI